MRKISILLFVIIIIVVIVTYYLSGSTGLISSSKSKKILQESFSILTKINSADECKYYGPKVVMYDGEKEAYYQCYSNDYFF